MSLNQPNLTKAQRREAARLEAQRLAAENAARDARSKRIIWSILGALLAGLVAAVLLVAQPWQRPEGPPDFAAVPMSEVANVPANTMPDGGFILTADGGTTGVLDPNLPTLEIFFDYHCIFCYQFERINLENMRTLAANHEANVVLHPVAILNRFTPRTHYSTRSVAAAGWIAQYAPEHFLDFHEVIFNNQPQEGGGDLTNEQIAAFAEQAGIPASVTAGIADGTAAQTFGQWAVSLTQEVVVRPEALNEQGTFGTPAIALNGVRWGGDWSDPTAIPAAIAELHG
jgi:protein-disulfide isomerase